MKWLFKNRKLIFFKSNIFNMLSSFAEVSICFITGNWWYMLLVFLTIPIAAWGSMKYE